MKYEPLELLFLIRAQRMTVDVNIHMQHRHSSRRSVKINSLTTLTLGNLLAQELCSLLA